MQILIDFDSPQCAAMVAHALEAAARQCREHAAERGETRPTNAKLMKAEACEAACDAIREDVDAVMRRADRGHRELALALVAA